jgi:hypothetical protein
MHGVRQLLAAAGIVVLATVGSAVAQTGAPTTTTGLQSFAQTDKPSTVTRVKIWTRSKLEAAQKRWAEDNAKFADCQKQLLEQRKTKRFSLHKQGHFLQDCMNRKP